MTTTTDLSRSTRVQSALGALAADPFTSLRYHFGMLLGVDDFEAEQAYHRGKQWFHTAWLHGKGVVWGYDVAVATEAGEIRVAPGVAIDGAGRELYLSADHCLDLAAWYAEHEDEAFGFEVEDDGTVRFDARVVVRFGSCLARQVPALGDECNRSATGTAYSRVEEAPELLLRPLGDSRYEDPPIPPSHLLRLLFGLDEPHHDAGGDVLAADQAVLDARDTIAALPAADQPAACLEAFRRFAARDGIAAAEHVATGADLGYPHPDVDLEVTLAEVRDIVLVEGEDGIELSSAADADPTVRPSLLATRTIQELLCHGALAAAAAGEGNGGGEEAAGAAAIEAPQVVRSSVAMPAADRMRFDIAGPVERATVRAQAVQVMVLGGRGWDRARLRGPIQVTAGEVAAAGGPVAGVRVSVRLRDELAEEALVRLVVRGTGASPLLGEGYAPLAGAYGDPIVSSHDGKDFVHMADQGSLRTEEDDA